MKKFKIAFAGFRHGHIYSLLNLVRNYNNIEIVGAWEKNEQARADAEAQGVNFTYNTYEELLYDSDVDIVAIGDYYGIRGELTLEALIAGKHVIADKPLCTSMEEAEKIEKISYDKNLKVGLMLDMRYHKNVVRAQQIIDSGVIGDVNNIYFGGQHPLRYGTRPSWYFEEGKHGGTINDIAIHGIDLVRRFTKSDVNDVLAARCWNFYADKEPRFNDSAQAMLTMKSGTGVIADVSYAAPDSHGFALPTYWEFKIWGKNGILQFNANSDGVELYKSGETEAEILPPLEPSKNYLDDFLSDITENSFDNTNSVIASTKQTLNIQSLSK